MNIFHHSLQPSETTMQQLMGSNLLLLLNGNNSFNTQNWNGMQIWNLIKHKGANSFFF